MRYFENTVSIEVLDFAKSLWAGRTSLGFQGGIISK